MKNEKNITRNKELVKRLTYLELRKGITKNKEDYEEGRWRNYVRKVNQFYEIFEPEKRIYSTEGSRKEGRHTYPTKSNIEWEKENYKKYIFVKKKKISQKTGRIYETLYKYRLAVERPNPELLYIKRSLEEEIIIPPRKEKVILIIENYLYYIDMEINPNELGFSTKIKIKNKNAPIYVEKYFPDKSKEFKSIYGKITGEELLNTIIGTTTKIYKGYIEDEVIEKIIE